MKRTININFENKETGEVFSFEGQTINCVDNSRAAFLNGIYKYIRNSGVVLGLLKYGWFFNIYIETIVTAELNATGEIEVNPFLGQFKLDIN